MSNGKKNNGEYGKHPYMKKAFWKDKANHFWNTENHTEKAKQYFNESIRRLIERSKEYTPL